MNMTASNRILETMWVDDVINAWPPEFTNPWYSIFGDVDDDIHEAIILDDEMKDAAAKGLDGLWKRLAIKRESRIESFRIKREGEWGAFVCFWPNNGGLRKIENACFSKWMKED